MSYTYAFNQYPDYTKNKFCNSNSSEKLIPSQKNGILPQIYNVNKENYHPENLETTLRRKRVDSMNAVCISNKKPKTEMNPNIIEATVDSDDDLIEYTYQNNNKTQGTAKVTSVNKDQLEYTFKNNMKNGSALLKYADGHLEKFIYKNDTLHGKASLSYPNGDVMDFIFKNGQEHGKATLKYANNDLLEFKFKNGSADGKATLKFNNGGFMNLAYKNNDAQGPATLKFANGDVLKFTHKNGKEEGPATLTFKNGFTLKGSCIFDIESNRRDFTSLSGLVISYVEGIRQSEKGLG